MKRINACVLNGLLMCSCVTFGNDVSVSVSPLAVRLNYEERNIDLLSNFGVQSGYRQEGLELGILFKLDGDGDERIKPHEWLRWTEHVRAKEQPDISLLWKGLLFKDSNIKPFGPCTGMITHVAGYHPEWDGREMAYYFTFDRFPSPDVEWIRITGEVPVELLSGQLQTPFVSVVIGEEETKADMGPFKVSVLRILKDENSSKVVIQFKLEQESQDYFLDELSFTDVDGIPVKGLLVMGAAQGYKMLNSFRNDPNCIVYVFPEGVPAQLKVSVEYRRLTRKKIPVDMKFQLNMGEAR